MSEFPGPGAYDIELDITNNDHYKGPKISGKYRDEITDSTRTPAPNHYKVIDKKNQKNITFSFSKEPKISSFYSDNKVPGPTHYSISTEFSKSEHKRRCESFRSTNSSTFGFAKKGIKTVSKSPAPDNYNVRTNLLNKTFSIGSKRTPWLDDILNKKEIVPGPMAYYVKDSARKNTPHFNMSQTTGRFIRPKKIKKENPGPGAYNIRGNICSKKGKSFGKPPRKLNFSFDDSRFVGPGSYNIKSTVPQVQPWERDKLADIVKLIA